MDVQTSLTFVYAFFVCCTAQRSASKDESLDPLKHRIIIPSVEELMDSSTVGTRHSWISDTTSIFPSPSMASIKPENSDCQDVAVDFAYRNNLCAGARNPEHCLSLATSRYTCLDRCGEAPSYGERFSQCACDVSCAAFGDCCRDMADICPDLQNIGKNIQYPYELHKYTGCNDYVVVYTNDDAPSTFNSAPNPPVTPSFVSVKKKLPFKPRSLAELTLPLKRYKVLDLPRKLIFENYFSYGRFRTTNSTPHYIPKVSYLSCSMPHSEADELPTAQEILPWCRVTYLNDAITAYRRPCKEHQLLICNCGDSRPFTDHVHNVCLGRNISSPYRQTLWNTQVKYGISSSEQIKICSVLKTSALGSSLENVIEQYEPQYTMMMRVLPVHKISRTPSKTPGRSIESQKETGKDQHLEVGVKVELSNTLERRYHCSSLQNRLQDCRVERCAAGVLLWNGGASHHDHSVGRSCIIPVEARVFFQRASPPLPYCICINIFLTLNEFGLWNAGLKIEGGACSVELVTLPSSKYCFRFLNFFFFDCEK